MKFTWILEENEGFPQEVMDMICIERWLYKLGISGIKIGLFSKKNYGTILVIKGFEIKR